MSSFFYRIPLVAASEKYEYGVYMLNLPKDCYNRFLLSLIEKHLNEPIIYYSFSFLIEKSFWNLSSLLHNLTYCHLNLFLSLSIFSVFLSDFFFFRWLAYKSFLSRFSVFINYIMWSDNLFSVSSCFPCFSWSSLFRVQVFQGLSPGSGPKF